jgi:hypothetical protein
MSDAWGAWNEAKQEWHPMSWTSGTKVPHLMERKETAEDLVRSLGAGWKIKRWEHKK